MSDLHDDTRSAAMTDERRGISAIIEAVLYPYRHRGVPGYVSLDIIDALENNGFTVTKPDAATPGPAPVSEAEIRDAAWKIADACEAAVQHSFIDYGDAINAIERGNQYDRLHIRPAIDALVNLLAARTTARAPEPTEAEIEAAALEAACEREWNRIMGTRAYSWRQLIEANNPDWQPAIDEQREAMREAISVYLAARNAGQNGGAE